MFEELFLLQIIINFFDFTNLKEIRNLYTYVRDSVKEADAKLNDQWQEFISKTKKSKKQKEVFNLLFNLAKTPNLTRVYHHMKVL